MDSLGGGGYEWTITVPSDATSIVYSFTSEDTSGNTNSTSDITMNVTDNDDPVADAGENQNVTEEDEVQFDGSGSTDNIGVTSYSWTFEYDGGQEELTGEDPSFTFDLAGTYEVTLTVTDEAGNEDLDTVMIHVEELPDTEDPVADAGEDQTVTVGDTVQFDGSGSTDNEGITNYTWTFTYDSEDVELYGIDPEFIFEIAGDYSVTLTAEDEAGNTGSDTMVVTVEEEAVDTEAPTADAGTDTTTDIGGQVTFDGSGSSDNVDIVNYTWAFNYGGEEIKLYGVSPSFTFDEAGTYTVTLTVRDAVGNEDTQTMQVTVEEEEDEGDDAGDEISMPWIWLLLLAIVILIIILIWKNRQKEEEEETPSEELGEETEEPVEGEEELDEGISEEESEESFEEPLEDEEGSEIEG